MREQGIVRERVNGCAADGQHNTRPTYQLDRGLQARCYHHDQARHFAGFTPGVPSLAYGLMDRPLFPRDLDLDAAIGLTPLSRVVRAHGVAVGMANHLYLATRDALIHETLPDAMSAKLR